MIDLLRWALQRHERSKDSARQRLRVILVLDRVGISFNYIESMKLDFLEVVSRYLDVDEGSVSMDMRRDGESMVLVSNINVRGIQSVLPRPVEDVRSGVPAV